MRTSICKKISIGCAVVLILCALSAMTSQGQTIIPRIGMTLSRTTWSWSDREQYKVNGELRKGLIIGLAYETSLKEGPFVFQTELTYIEKGFKETVSYPNNVDKHDYSFKFLEVPVILKAELGTGKIKFLPHLGLSVAYALEGDRNRSGVYANPNTGEISLWTQKNEITFSFSDQQGKRRVGSPLDFGVQTGRGFKLFDKVIMDLRYSIGLTNFEFIPDESLQNRVIQISAGVPIRIGRTKS